MTPKWALPVTVQPPAVQANGVKLIVAVARYVAVAESAMPVL
jgi:hypothetical protein